MHGLSPFCYIPMRSVFFDSVVTQQTGGTLKIDTRISICVSKEVLDYFWGAGSKALVKHALE